MNKMRRAQGLILEPSPYKVSNISFHHLPIAEEYSNSNISSHHLPIAEEDWWALKQLIHAEPPVAATR
jgi:hypothetical protein